MNRVFFEISPPEYKNIRVFRKVHVVGWSKNLPSYTVLYFSDFYFKIYGRISIKPGRRHLHTAFVTSIFLITMLIKIYEIVMK